MCPRWPENFDFGGLATAQSEVQTLIIGRFVASGGGGEACLPVHHHTRSLTVAIASRTPECDRQPVRASSPTAIDKELRMRPQNRGYGVDPAIIVNISKRRSSARDQRVSSGIGSLEASVAINSQQRGF